MQFRTWHVWGLQTFFQGLAQRFFDAAVKCVPFLESIRHKFEGILGIPLA